MFVILLISNTLPELNQLHAASFPALKTLDTQSQSPTDRSFISVVPVSQQEDFITHSSSDENVQ